MKRFFTLPFALPHLKASLASVGFRAFSALAVGKWIAVCFGPQGTALFGQLMNFYTAFAIMPLDGLSRAMVRDGAHAESNHTPEEADRVVSTSLGLLGVLYLIQLLVAIGIAWKTDWLEPFQSQGMVPWLLPSFVLLATSYYLANIFLVWKKNQFQAWASTSLSLGGLVGLGLTWFFRPEIQACLLGFVLGQALGGALIFMRFRHRIPFRFERFRFDGSRVRPMVGFMLAIATSGLFNQIGIYSLVHWALETVGEAPVGLWMAMGRFADAFNTPILAVANSILMPMLAGHASNSAALQGIMRPLFKRSVLGLALGMGILFFLYPYVLPILYSRAFHAETSWVAWQLVGDFFRSSTFVFSVLMLAKSDTRFYFGLESASVVVLLVSSRVLYEWLGFEGLFVAHAVRYGLYWLALVIRYRDLLW